MYARRMYAAPLSRDVTQPSRDVCKSSRVVSQLSRDVSRLLRDVSQLSCDVSNLSRDVTHFLHNTFITNFETNGLPYSFTAFCSMVMVKRLQFQHNKLTQSMMSLVPRLIPPFLPRIRDRTQFPVATNTTSSVAKTLELCRQGQCQ